MLFNGFIYKTAKKQEVIKLLVLKNKVAKINVVGLGYVGLPAALKFANNSYDVLGTDLDKELLRDLQAGYLSFDENGMQEELNQALQQKISFQNHCESADLYIVAVPTHFDRKTKKIDPKHLIAATKSILAVCPEEAIIVIESTVSPGTIEQHLRPLVENQTVHFAHAPERIIPGMTMFELVHNDRVIGADTKEIANIVKEVYSSFCKGTIRTTDIQTAELTKVVENTFRDINIAYANELKKICHQMDIDVKEVISLANCHPRVNILNPSAGVGGHCISVDPWFLVGDHPKEAQLIAAAREINDSMPAYTWNKMSEKVDVSKKTIGIYGLAYKPDIDDVRESPSIQLLDYLKKNNLDKNVYFFDPFINKQLFKQHILDFSRFTDMVDVILIMTPHGHLNGILPMLNDKGIPVYDPFYNYPEAITV